MTVDHHAAQGLVHARMHQATTALARRSTDPERGQGSVEYVALILLVGGVLAAAVALAGEANLNLAKIISKKMEDTINAVGGG